MRKGLSCAPRCLETCKFLRFEKRNREGNTLPVQTIDKASQSFFAAAKKEIQSVFCGDMCVAENTSHETSVEMGAAGTH